jgi:hypothetical protein
MKHISQILLLILLSTLTISSLHLHEVEQYSYEVFLELDEEMNCDLCDVLNSTYKLFLISEFDLNYYPNKSDNSPKLQSNLEIVSPTYINLRGPPSYNF